MTDQQTNWCPAHLKGRIATYGAHHILSVVAAWQQWNAVNACEEELINL